MAETNQSATRDEPVTISAPPSTSVEIDPQNPLPEPSFFYRRVLAYIVVIAALILTWHAAEALHDLREADHLLAISKWTIGFGALIATYYYVAPSAAELVNIIQSARIIKGGVALAAKQAENRAEIGQGEAKRPSALPDSQIPEEAPDEAPRGSDADSGEDAAPRGRS